MVSYLEGGLDAAAGQAVSGNSAEQQRPASHSCS